MTENPSHVRMVANIAASFFANQKVSADQIPATIQQINDALTQLTAPPPVVVPLEPVVPIKKSVFPDHIVCLEDGLSFKSLKRHLLSAHNLSPAEYRAKWGLPEDYPMVAPNYSSQRSELAKTFGLGSKIGSHAESESETVTEAHEDEAHEDAGGANNLSFASVSVQQPEAVEKDLAEAETQASRSEEFQDDDEAPPRERELSEAPGTLPEGYSTVLDTFSDDGIVCLLDGKVVKDLGRYARRHFNLSADDYRARFGLPATYPMTQESVERFIIEQ